MSSLAKWIFSTSINIFHPLPLSVLLLCLLHEVWFQISVVLLSVLLMKLKSVGLTLAGSCSSCEHKLKASWWGHTGILFGALVGIVKRFMLLPARARAGWGTSPGQGSAAWQALEWCWPATNWWIISCVLRNMVLFRATRQCRSWAETALWDPSYRSSNGVAFHSNPLMKSFRCPCIWRHGSSCWILCWVFPQVEDGCSEQCLLSGNWEPVSQAWAQVLLLPCSWSRLCF